MQEPIIEVKNLGKKYSIQHERGRYVALRDVLMNVARAPLNFLWHKTKKVVGLAETEEFWSLKNVSFTVRRGEVIGIIGANGAGKSTLLKILSQITPPTTGQAILRGKIGSLLEVGTGFHPELTGRENIFLNGAILGMKHEEIRNKFSEIVEFAGIEKFLDTPVKHYSSGMYVRLAFSVAAHMDPDILIVDEVLAVGDAEFQKKCLGKMEEITETADRTILFVSHNMGAIQSLCSKTLLLEKGQIAFAGETSQAIGKYLGGIGDSLALPVKDRKDRKGAGPLRFTDLKIEGPNTTDHRLATGKPFRIKLNFKIDEGAPQTLNNVSVCLTINDQFNGNHLLAFWTETSGSNFKIDGGQKVIECQVSSCPLVYGQYFINIYCTVNGILSDYIINAGQVMIDDTEYFSRGTRDAETHPKYVVDHKWKLT